MLCIPYTYTNHHFSYNACFQTNLFQCGSHIWEPWCRYRHSEWVDVPLSPDQHQVQQETALSCSEVEATWKNAHAHSQPTFPPTSVHGVRYPTRLCFNTFSYLQTFPYVLKGTKISFNTSNVWQHHGWNRGAVFATVTQGPLARTATRRSWPRRSGTCAGLRWRG